MLIFCPYFQKVFGSFTVLKKSPKWFLGIWDQDYIHHTFVLMCTPPPPCIRLLKSLSVLNEDLKTLNNGLLTANLLFQTYSHEVNT